ncbi:MAG: stimulus-sensing domain-containing protein [Bosea sp. (in: a-proteobacteria)]
MANGKSARPGRLHSGLANVRGFMRWVGHWLASRLASSLTRRILVLNLAGLVVLLIGLLYINQFREGLIDARVQSLQTQGEIIASAIAASATVETDTIAIDPDRLLQLQAGESSGLGDDLQSILEFSINPERVGPLLRRLVMPTRTRARVYDREGFLVVDSGTLNARGDILRRDLAPVVRDDIPMIERTWNTFRRRLGRAEISSYDETDTVLGKSIPEVARALQGQQRNIVRVNALGDTIVSVAVPIQRQRNVRGVLLLSTQGGDIDAVIASERVAIFQVFAVAALAMTLLSVLLANAIGEPLRKLSDAAVRVRRRVRSRQEIPDFTARHDEIGQLSGALRDMTSALYARIDAIGSFAADVAHELKNPLTSLRSAVETLPLARSEPARDRLLAVIQHDVRRLDRLITDISDASRLDAELARGEMAPVDIERLVETVVGMQNEVRTVEQSSTTLTVKPAPKASPGWLVQGHDGRIGQVLINILDNARSFSPVEHAVRVELSRDAKHVTVIIDDDGPGIPEHALERIFERFYTDRPGHGFGQNSGLGLSISRQIIEAHGGTIMAANRSGPVQADGGVQVAGARFTIQLPALPSALPAAKRK